MSHGSRRHPIEFPSPRVSAWLADIQDWDADDADVFIATLGRGRSAPASARDGDASSAVERSA